MEKFRFIALWACLIMIGIYLLQVLIPGFTDFFLLNKTSFFQPWRFLTSIFLHGSLPHLLYNLFALALFGSILEKFIATKKFLLVFFASGLLANLVAVNFYDSSLGASGAVYGILGCLSFIKPKMFVWVYGLPMPMFLAAAIWTLGSVFGMFIPSNTGHIAHLSGILAGFIFGILIVSKMPKGRKIRRADISENYIRQWEDTYMR